MKCTKEDPGEFDCYAKLAPDEPYFVLRAKDPNAPALVELWAALREAQHGEYPKLAEARACADEMRRWRAAHPPGVQGFWEAQDYKPLPQDEPLPAQD